MSNEMMIPGGKPKYLAKAQPTGVDEFLGGVQGGMPLPMLSVRGKEFRLRFQGQEMNTRARDVDVILVAARPAVSKRFFAKQYSSGDTVAPDCSSVDGVTPDVPEPISPKCATCPKNAWGSKITESGKQAKACNDYKRLVVLPIINGQLMDQPSVIDVAATSLKSPKGYKGNDLFLREYLGALQRHDIPVQAAVTTLQFTDAEYPQVCFKFSRFAEEDEFSRATALREDDDVQDVLTNGGAVEAPGPIQQTETPPAQPAAQAAPPEPTVFVFNMQSEDGAEIPQSKLDDYKAQGYAEVPEAMYRKLTGTTPDPKADDVAKSAAHLGKQAATQKAEASPEPAPAADDDADDVMAEIKKLLG
jgi:hypothetical protein